MGQLPLLLRLFSTPPALWLVVTLYLLFAAACALANPGKGKRPRTLEDDIAEQLDEALARRIDASSDTSSATSVSSSWSDSASEFALSSSDHETDGEWDNNNSYNFDAIEQLGLGSARPRASPVAGPSRERERILRQHAAPANAGAAHQLANQPASLASTPRLSRLRPNYPPLTPQQRASVIPALPAPAEGATRLSLEQVRNYFATTLLGSRCLIEDCREVYSSTESCLQHQVHKHRSTRLGLELGACFELVGADVEITQQQQRPQIIKCKFEGCKSKFSTNERMLGHYREVHLKEDFEWRCDACNMTLGRFDVLENHRTCEPHLHRLAELKALKEDIGITSLDDQLAWLFEWNGGERVPNQRICSRCPRPQVIKISGTDHTNFWVHVKRRHLDEYNWFKDAVQRCWPRDEHGNLRVAVKQPAYKKKPKPSDDNDEDYSPKKKKK